ncbi:GNAT family N-acetyltransferase [Winogradskyella sp.]|uniref:GNAT family N-acetyltransferase n=1 Tax=Winogradskyella sp. TaxID=1883156 RepID=UPI003F6A546D
MISISDSIQLQAIKIDNQPQLMRLIQRIYPPAYEHLWKNKDCSFYFNKFYSHANLEADLSDKNAEYYFVYYHSKLAGIIRFIFNDTYNDFKNEPATYLNRIYLGIEAQGKGVAAQLLNWIEQKAVQKGNYIIWLKAMDSQKQALSFYEKQRYNYGSSTNLGFKLLQSEFRGMHTMYKFLN